MVAKVTTTFHKHRMPVKRPGETISISVNGVEGYVVTGELADGNLGEIFIYLTKEGSTLRGWGDAFAIAFSGCLQFAHDPREALKWLLVKLIGQNFEPNGWTNDPGYPEAKSIIDFIAHQLAVAYLTAEEREEIGVILHEPIATL